MAYDNNEKKQDNIYSKKIRAGKRRTYFFDIKETRSADFFLTITESRKRFDDNGYDRHKIFVYKEDFNKFIKCLNEAVDHVKIELMPNFDFDAFNHEYPENGENEQQNFSIAEVIEQKLEATTEIENVVAAPEHELENEIITTTTNHETVDKW